MMGILRMRDELKRRQGEQFDLKEFHNLVLGAGPMPLPVLEKRVLGGGA